MRNFLLTFSLLALVSPGVAKIDAAYFCGEIRGYDKKSSKASINGRQINFDKATYAHKNIKLGMGCLKAGIHAKELTIDRNDIKLLTGEMHIMKKQNEKKTALKLQALAQLLRR